MSLYEMPDGNQYEFASDADATKALMAWNQQFGKQEQKITEPTNAEKVSAQIRKPMVDISGQQGLDFLVGATGLMRGGANLAGGLFGNEKLGEQIWPSKGADKTSGTYIAGSLFDPVGLLTGLGIARAIPYAPVLGKGFIEGAKSLGKNVGVGALTGGAIGGLSEDSTAIGGAAIGGAGAAAIPLVFGAANMVAPAVSKKFAQKGAAKQLIEVAGNDAKIVADKLAAGQPVGQSQIETAAQSLANLNNPKISALQKFWTGKYGSTMAYRNELAQKDLEAARLEFLGAETAPQRDAAIQKANVVTRAFNIAKTKGTEYRTEAAKLVSNVRNVENLKQSAGEQAVMLDVRSQARSMDVGGPRVGGRNISRANELIDVSERKSSEFAEQSLRAGASARLAENIVGRLEHSGLEPISADKFISAINSVKNKPENIVNDSLRLLSTRITNAVKRAADANNGVLDAASLDALRRTAISDFIDSAARGNPSQAKKIASHETTKSFKKFIDDVIESSGGKGYKDYMHKYSSAREKIEAPLLRMEKSDEMANRGMEEIIQIMNDQKIHGIGVLERTVTLLQSFLRGAKGIAGKNVGKQGAELMINDPRKLGKMMQEELANKKLYGINPGIPSAVIGPGIFGGDNK